MRKRTARPLHRSPRTSLAIGSVAAIVVASPLAVLVGEAPNNAVNHQAPGAIAPTKTVINSVSLNQLPTMALDLVRSGLAQAGVTLPPIDVSGIQLPDIPIQVPPGLIPPGLVPTETPTTSAAPAAPNPTPAAGSPNLPAGATDAAIKEITQSKPFSMVALTWDGLTDTTAYIRAKQPNGQWGQWFSADGTDGNATHRAGKQGTEPIWVGNTDAVQVAVTKNGQAERVKPATSAPAGGNAVPSTTPNAPALPTTSQPSSSLPTVSVAPGQIKQQAFTARQEPPAVPPAPPAPPAAPAAPAPNAAPAPGAPAPAPNAAPPPTSGAPAPTSGNGALQTVVNTLKAILIAPGTSPGDSSLGSSGPQGGKPPIISREQWGADESMRCSQPTYDPQLKAAVVHHSAGSNDYSPAQSAEIVRGIYAYHAQTLGWCDIGYNAVVDKYGQIFEGAYGGLDKNVEGTHTGGFNPDTVGVVMLGNLNDVPPTPAQIESTGRYLGWRLGLAGLNPTGTATLVSQGFDGSQYGAGESVTKPVISGHRDYDETDCPGNYGYEALDQIRQVAAGKLTLPMQPSPADPDSGTQNNLVDNNSAAPAPGGAGPATTTGAVPPAPNGPGAGTPSGPVLTPSDVGAIAAKWVELGGSNGQLGRALSAETVTPDGKATYANFQNGLIYWSATTGAQVIWGLIEKAWAALGFQNSPLGLPTGGETITGNLVSQTFQFGKLIFNTSTGIVSQVVQTYLNELQKNLKNPPASSTAPPAPAAPAPAPAAAPVPAPPAAPAPTVPAR